MAPPRPLAAVVPGIAGKVLGKRGLAFATLITDWDALVGPLLGAHTLPEKLSFPGGKREHATLTIRVAGGFSLEVQHSAPQIIERINRFFGYTAIARLKLVHGPLPRSLPLPQRTRTLNAAENAAVAAAVAPVADEAIRAALARFGTALQARPAPHPAPSRPTSR